MPVATMDELLNAGVHFGHLTRRWNPKMRNYIFMQRNGIYIIDLKKTQKKLDEACNAIQEIARKDEKILFVGTKKQAKDIVEFHAKRCGQPYMKERWLGGTLTNFGTIKRRLRHLQNLERMEVDGTYDKISKKEILTIEKQKEKLLKVLGGITEMNKLPGALFMTDIIKDVIAVSEAKKLEIPIFALVDTNCDPDGIDYPIPGNDDSYKSIEIITRLISDAILSVSVKEPEPVENPEAV
ncbi:30S ribosomal protein S2 [candidate division KSB1 bacterium]|nr:30S ribosomal protein S2 [candidate division KSB1 bacterium]